MKTGVKSRIYKNEHDIHTPPKQGQKQRRLIAETTEMREQSVEKKCGQNVVKRRKESDEQVDRMQEGKVVMIDRDRSRRGRRSLERSRKRLMDVLSCDDSGMNSLLAKSEKKEEEYYSGS